jgi:hypothetical protein
VVLTLSRRRFLLAALQLESLKKCTTQRDLLTKADQLPTVADGLYKLTMGRIEDQGEAEVSLAKHALLWVTYAHGYLTIDDLRSALARVSPKEGIDPYDRPTEAMILSCCCGLLVVDQTTKIVRLSRKLERIWVLNRRLNATNHRLHRR